MSRRFKIFVEKYQFLEKMFIIYVNRENNLIKPCSYGGWWVFIKITSKSTFVLLFLIEGSDSYQKFVIK